ncbi:endo-1,3-beta-glucanase Engl1 [Aspergillus sclerotiicarbonarius CBS 121057]|uniref:Glucan endo-1,3-beta-D-glucosidase 1 n=1 Tax=Aspergillus sclerotiicarbonarius (strain CBS 121057 / IBT 28362) TaxID=1448318 RepID=A0A319E4G1_ASPSB|nr:endo-1,3-beta-glucanase Engl1 [Aspergillus sclerotiicarbonarius CBS 121057]
METKQRWTSSVLLTWLLAARGVYSAPTVTSSAAFTEKTQYPPAAESQRLLIPGTQGFYPTSLEREGHPWRPTPSPTGTEDRQAPWGIDSVFDALDKPQELPNELLSGLLPSWMSDFPVTVPASAYTPAAPIATTSSVKNHKHTKPYHSQSGTWTTTTQQASGQNAPESTSDPVEETSELPSPESSTTSASQTSSAETSEPSSPESFTTSASQTSSAETSKPPSPESSTTSASQTSSAEISITSTVVPSSVTPMSGGQDVFVPLATGPIPQTITARNDHPVPKKGIETITTPIETNKFYAGLFLGSQTNATFTHPYAITWAKGAGNAGSYGMVVSHNEANVVANGPTNANIPGNPISYYVNPIGIQHMILSATELNSSTVLTAENLLPFSADAVLSPSSGSNQRIIIPLVQGMGLVTGMYTNLQPLIQSSVFFSKVVTASSPRIGIYKYKMTLADGGEWIVYAIPQDGTDPDFRLESNTNFRGPSGWSGTIQITKNPAGASGEKLLDGSAGVFALEAAVSGSVLNGNGTYNLAWAKSGKQVQETPLLMYALPHHVESFDNTTKSRMTSITLRTTTKGNATAVIGETWTMVEPNLPTDMGFAPWSASTGSANSLSSAAQKVILDVAPTELNQSIDQQTNLNSMYYSGKGLSKFATLVYAVSKLGGNPDLAASALQNLKNAFALFINNKQQFPLVYDSVWRGVVSSASYGGDSGADFGNTYYNDHHFHYGYFIHAAAIIGSLDPTWLTTGNKDWVNMLVRDAGNSAANDPYFPFSRAFDWYNGHSWAKGLFESYDGKDEESTSEDSMFAYALKMWGKTIADASMEARGNLMLGILRRSLHNYFLMESDNKNQPANFIANKVTGILFENKVDHTTYFGSNLEYIQGIHMLPLLPSSSYVRRQNFVREEWNALFASNATDPAAAVTGGWKGVLYANLALIDPASSWEFFAQSNFDYSWLDGGASRTWYLAFAAGMGGGP